MADFDISVARCNHCHSLGGDEELICCPRCKIVMYCTQDHQALDWLSHRAACRKIQKARGLVDEEEAKLLGPNGPLNPLVWGNANPFEAAVGLFWEIQ
jgi:MYND finger